DLVARAADVRRLEGELRMALGVEEVGRLQMGVQVLVLDVDARDPGRAGQAWTVAVRHQGGLDVPEVSAEGPDQVADLEADRRMDRIESPGAGGDSLPGCCRDGHLHSSLSPV